MTISFDLVFAAVPVGAGATLFMDLWALLVQRVFNVPPPNYCVIGRWLCYMPAGTFTHATIAETPAKSAECAVGWVFHYLVGIAYAVLLLLVASAGWLEHPTLYPALLVGAGTVVVPFFIMQPCLGWGIAASKTPNPPQARLKSLVAHSVFGVGLYVTALLFNNLS